MGSSMAEKKGEGKPKEQTYNMAAERTVVGADQREVQVAEKTFFQKQFVPPPVATAMLPDAPLRKPPKKE